MKELPQRFYSLDVLRGLGALVIVFNHWPNFFYYQFRGKTIDPALLPLYPILKPLYTDGWRAVDMFFCLSGFIFFWLYSEKIKSRFTTVKEFSILRFSRLYPLHLATLLLVAGGQILMWRIYGSWFVYDNNDVSHFISQLFFASALFGNSFNGPTWSVSVEILLYGMFFLVCRLKCIRWWQLLIYAGLGEFWVIHHGLNGGIARGVLSFFAGGFSFQVFLFLWGRRLSAPVFKVLGASTLLFWILIPLEAKNHYFYSCYQSLFGHEPMKVFAILRKVIFWVSQGACELLLFPLTLITLALWESRRGTLGRRLAILGDISYSTYLLHFPLQMLFVMGALALGISGTFFSSPIALLLFLAILIPISLGSYHCLERPAQSLFRSHLLGPQKK
jgi:peptidoglycan/LPS O-acetylase OafA/YrhL